MKPKTSSHDYRGKHPYVVEALKSGVSGTGWTTSEINRIEKYDGTVLKVTIKTKEVNL